MSKTSSVLDGRAVGIMILLCAVWGLQSVSIKVAVADVPPILQAGLRSVMAVTVVGLWALLTPGRLFDRDRSLWPGIAAGLLFAGEFLLLYWGIEYTTASRAILFLYTSPFVVALGVHLLVPGERLDRWQAAGLLCAFTGVAVAVADGLRLPTRDQLIGDLLILAAAVLWGATTVLIKASTLSRTRAVKTLLYQLGGSALVLPPASLLMGEAWPSALPQWPAQTWVALVYQGLGVAAVSYLTWFWLITRYPAGRLAAFSFLTPLFGMVAGAVLLDEPVGPVLAGALVLVVVGIRLVNKKPPARARTAVAET